ncbi:hypothetical protein ASG60_20545 [Methylobacterium sp. Leaf469]|uniref:Crp/Fnr family transcriptional regulator n=1 Tax=Methylobacterium sp. Leaf469 TaxID=1736387 RepID=UPI0006FBAC3B|nr:Crp/Fnr family transcriptional regulator [Methylobacterium sp. Leaf469]KQT96119.1 hypothetical protein ASG60_20545 [Methylobacterium sp. Leaf469]
MFSSFICKLEHGANLTDADRTRLAYLPRGHRIAARQPIITKGTRPENVHIVLDGFACRYKMLRNGKRQIIALLVPGDCCDLNAAILGTMDHSIATLSSCTIAILPRATILDLNEQHPRIAHALRWTALVDEAIAREWLVNMGKRDASRRFAHLFCELRVRLRMVGIGNEDGYPFPLRQEDMADAVGLTSVHTNRTVQSLREKGLLRLQDHKLHIPDAMQLEEYCDFDPAYLHLHKRVD